jgi:Calcineurin-like phosphoesterase
MISDALQDGEIDDYGSCNSNNNNNYYYNYTYAYNPSRELFYNDDDEEKKEVDLLEDSYHPHHQQSGPIFFSIHGTASSFEEESSFHDDDDEEDEEDFFAYKTSKGKGRRACSFWIYVCLTVTIIVGLTVTGQQLRATAQPKRRKRSTTKPRLHFRHVIRAEQPQQEQQHDDVVYRFKIVQLADLHLGGEVGGTETDDGKTYQLIDTILKAEHPDLIVLSGDQISADHLLDNAVAYYQSLGEYLTTYGIPWCMIFGDSDDADYHIPGGNSTSSNETLPAKYHRNELLQVDMNFPLSLTQRGPDTIFGMTNYILTVYVKEEEDDDNDDTGDVPAAAIYLLDSGGGSLPVKLRQNQIDWFYNSDGRLPAVAFQHYPTREFQFQKDKCMGHVKGKEQEDEEATTATDDATAIPLLLLLQQEQQEFHLPSKNALELEDPGIANAMSESTRVYFLAVGHDHGNDYCCPFTAWLQVCYGRQSGHGGDDGDEYDYDDDGTSSTWERGARVYELEIQNVHDYKMKWKSWVRLGSGTIQDPVTMNDIMKARTKKEPS